MGYITSVPGNIGDSVGTLSLQTCKRSGIPAGKVPADGQELSQTVYASLYQWAASGAVATTDEASWQGSINNRAMWVLNSKTPGCFRIADLNGVQPGSLTLFGRGSASDSSVGSILRDQLQNITGSISAYDYNGGGPTGAFAESGRNASIPDPTGALGARIWRATSFDAGRVARVGTETYPSHFTGIWCYQAFGAVANTGSIDAVQLATQVAALQAQLSLVLQPSMTGTATFTRSTNNILMSGIVTQLSLGVGDVIQITGTANNNFTMTVEVVTDNNNIVVNYEHRNGAGTLSLINETISCTIKRIVKGYSAALGLGQGIVNVSTHRSNGSFYTNQTGRAFMAYAYANSGGTSSYLYVDRGNNPVSTVSGGAPNGNAMSVSVLVPPGGLYRWLWGGGASVVEISEIR